MPQSERDALRAAVKAQQQVIARPSDPVEPSDELDRIVSERRRQEVRDGRVAQ